MPLCRIGHESKRVSDKTPGNFLWIGLIRVVFPKTRIIHCRRNPAGTCLSDYFTGLGKPVPFAYSKADLVLFAGAGRSSGLVVDPAIQHTAPR